MVVLPLPPVTPVSDAVLLPEASVGVPANAVLGNTVTATPAAPFIVMVSVAPLLTDPTYKVASVDEDVSVTTAAEDVAETPNVERVVSLLMAVFSAVAMEVVESPL